MFRALISFNNSITKELTPIGVSEAFMKIKPQLCHLAKLAEDDENERIRLLPKINSPRKEELNKDMYLINTNMCKNIRLISRREAFGNKCNIARDDSQFECVSGKFLDTRELNIGQICDLILQVASQLHLMLLSIGVAPYRCKILGTYRTSLRKWPEIKILVDSLKAEAPNISDVHDEMIDLYQFKEALSICDGKAIQVPNSMTGTHFHKMLAIIGCAKPGGHGFSECTYNLDIQIKLGELIKNLPPNVDLEGINKIYATQIPYIWSEYSRDDIMPKGKPSTWE